MSLFHPSLLSRLFAGDEMRGLSLSPRLSSPPAAPPADLEDEEGLKHLQQVWGCLCMLRASPPGLQSTLSHVSQISLTGFLACPQAQPPQEAQTCLSSWTSGGREAGGLPAGQLPGGGTVHRCHADPGPTPLHSRHCPSPQPWRCPKVVLQGPTGGNPR